MSTLSPQIGHPQDLLPPARRLGVATLTALIYFTVCGGAYGLEPVVSAVGPGWAVVLILVTPVVYSVPIALMAAELVALLPDEGGYYIWVRESFGRFWAVQEAWWTLAFGVFSVASYPVLFVSYLNYLLTHAGAGLVDPAVLARPLNQWLIALAVIASGAAINLLGALDVGRSALVAAVFVLAAFAAFIAVWVLSGQSPAHSAAVIAQDLVSGRRTDLLLGLSVIVFNYSAWDKVSSYAGEVDAPQRTYPIALAGALLLTVLSYLVPVLAGVGVSTEPALWSADAGWPAIAERFGGQWLGLALAAGGLVSMWSLFSAALLWVSRGPSVLAMDGWLPGFLAPSRNENAVPVAALIVASILCAGLAAVSFGDLVVVQTLFYTAALALEALALVYFRVKLPDAPRGFRVPGGRWGLAYACIAPLLFAVAVIYAAIRDAESYGLLLGLTAAIAGSGCALYWAGRRGRAGVAA